MQVANITLCKDFQAGSIDPRLYSSFVEHMGSVIYNGIYEPGHESADENGFRKDVLNLIQGLNIGTLRYPGGNYSSGYNWEDSVGSKEDRPVRLDFAWKQTEPNSFGLHEFMQWSKLVGSETIMTVNLGTRGIDDARNLLEYCNHQGGSYWSDLRRKNGALEPFHIKTWCLGNELDGKWQIGHKTAREYGRLASECARLMRYFDPNLQLIAAGSSASHMPTYPEWDRKVLMECYDEVDYIALHKYISHKDLDRDSFLAAPLDMDRQIETIIAAVDYVQSALRSKKQLMLSFDEWNVVPEIDIAPSVDWQVGPDRSKYSYTFEEVLVGAGMAFSLLRHSSRVKIACQALLVNVIPLILADKGGLAYKNGIYYPFELLTKYGVGVTLHSAYNGAMLTCKEFGDIPAIDHVATYYETSESVTVFAINRSPDPVDLQVHLGGFAISQGEQITLQSPLDARNSAESPDKLAARSVSKIALDNGVAHARLAPYSFHALRLN